MIVSESSAPLNQYFLGHVPDSVSTVPDFWDVRDYAQRIEAIGPQFGEVICKYGLHAVFGIALLHKHFTIASSLKLIRTYTTTKCSVSMGMADIGNMAIPYMWHL